MNNDTQVISGPSGQAVATFTHFCYLRYWLQCCCTVEVHQRPVEPPPLTPPHYSTTEQMKNKLVMFGKDIILYQHSF